ncbi:hypothetical protein PG994_008548 [Apiospora phragmitis]|uniref:C2H2-type domain-containing protein n=1 Tax=Apiospora phragmitis TaxID=2905665 RepID=A0ABR1UJ80_9PEZI
MPALAPQAMASYEQPPDESPGDAGRHHFDETPMPSLDNYPPDRDELFRCNRSHKKKGCEKPFKRKTELQKHLRTHEKPVYCPYYGDPNLPCPKGRAAEQKDMARHVVAHHPDWARLHGFVAEEVQRSAQVEMDEPVATVSGLDFDLV